MGAALSFAGRSRLSRGALVYTVLIALALSAVPYKTPWHAVHLVPGLALLAAAALTHLPRVWIAVLLAGMVLVLQTAQMRLAVLTRASDERNPYAYVHSSPDVLKFRALADSALQPSPDGVIRVIAGEYWPIPWYFRGLPHVGYWSAPPAVCDGALVIVSEALADEVRARLHGPYRERILGLRPGVLCVAFTPNP
jgi:predicted membrane-bound mannosyltransferase